MRLEGLVEVRHVGLVVLGVVQLHDLGRDVRLERIVGVGQGWQLVSGEAHFGEVDAVAGHGGVQRRLQGNNGLPQVADVDHFDFFEGVLFQA